MGKTYICCLRMWYNAQVLYIFPQFGTTLELIRFVPPHMGLPGFLGSSIAPIKAKSAKKKRGLVRENRRFDPLRLRSKQGSGQKIYSGERVKFAVRFRKNCLADFYNFWQLASLDSGIVLKGRFFGCYDFWSYCATLTGKIHENRQFLLSDFCLMGKFQHVFTDYD